MGRHQKQERNKEIVRKIKTKQASCRQLANVYNIHFSRVWQIYKEYKDVY